MVRAPWLYMVHDIFFSKIDFSYFFIHVKWKYHLQQSHETKMFSPTDSFKFPCSKNYSFHSSPTLCLRFSIPAACTSSFHTLVFSFLLLLPLQWDLLFCFVLFLSFHFIFLLQCYSLYFYFLLLVFSLTSRYSFLYQCGEDILCT